MTVTMRLVALLLAASFAGSAWPAPATPTDDRPRRHEAHRDRHGTTPDVVATGASASHA